MSLIILVAGWLIFFVVHSLLAAERTKEFVARFFGNSRRFYRLFYTIISTATLIFMLVLNGSIPSEHFFRNDGVVRYLSLMFTTFGVMTIQLSFRQYDFKSFVGFREEPKELKIGGILKRVRHPIYSGIILITIGFFLFIPNVPTMISCICILLYLPVGIYLEERKLIKTFGDEYRHYKTEVPTIMPEIPLRKIT
jgi:methanethiol S-methyltransferase